jgi:hypothetical protein
VTQTGVQQDIDLRCQADCTSTEKEEKSLAKKQCPLNFGITN